MMGIMSKLCGEQFWLAFCEAKDVTRAIKNGGEDFNKKCPPALISHFINGLSWEHERGHYYRYALLLAIISVTLATFCTLSSVFMGEFNEVLLLLFSWSLLLFSRLQMNTSFFSAYVYFYRIKRVVLESENASA